MKLKELVTYSEILFSVNISFKACFYIIVSLKKKKPFSSIKENHWISYVILIALFNVFILFQHFHIIFLPELYHYFPAHFWTLLEFILISTYFTFVQYFVVIIVSVDNNCIIL